MTYSIDDSVLETQIHVHNLEIHNVHVALEVPKHAATNILTVTKQNKDSSKKQLQLSTQLYSSQE